MSEVSPVCRLSDARVLGYLGGAIKIEDVKRGDVLMGEDSTPRIVRSVNTAMGTLYAVIPENSDPYTVDASHTLVTYVGEQRCHNTVQELLDMTFEERSKHTLHRHVITYAHENLPNDPYMIGMVVGGTYENARDILREYLAKKLDDIKSFVDGVQDIRKIFVSQDTTVISQLLEHKHIPDEYLYSSTVHRQRLLQGILEAQQTVARHRSRSMERPGVTMRAAFARSASPAHAARSAAARAASPGATRLVAVTTRPMSTAAGRAASPGATARLGSQTGSQPGSRATSPGPALTRSNSVRLSTRVQTSVVDRAIPPAARTTPNARVVLPGPIILRTRSVTPNPRTSRSISNFSRSTAASSVRTSTVQPRGRSRVADSKLAIMHNVINHIDAASSTSSGSGSSSASGSSVGSASTSSGTPGAGPGAGATSTFTSTPSIIGVYNHSIRVYQEPLARAIVYLARSLGMIARMERASSEYYCYIGETSVSKTKFRIEHIGTGKYYHVITNGHILADTTIEL